MSSRPDTTGSEEARVPRPPGPPPDAPARPEPDAAAEVPAGVQADVQTSGEGEADADGGSADATSTRLDQAAPGGEPAEEASAERDEEPGEGEADGTVADEGALAADSAVAGDGALAADAVDAADPPASLLPRDAQTAPAPISRAAVARGRLSHAMRPRATRAQLLAGLLCALLGFALVVQARQTQTQGLDQLRQADLVRLLDNVTNAEARAEQDVRNEQAIRDHLLSGSDSSEAAQQAAQQRLDTLGLLAGTVPASGPGIELEITDPRRQVDASVLLDTLEELRDGGAEVIQIGDVRVVAATAFTDDPEGVRVDGRLLTPPYRYKVIGDPQTLAKVLQIPGGVLDVLRSKGAQGRVTQVSSVRVDALRGATAPQYARPAPGGTP
jgi:uncharacterized protein YlxW (UPF0749 family)